MLKVAVERAGAHLVTGDANAAILLEHGLSPAHDRRETLRPRQCRSCSELNVPDVSTCEWCETNL